MTVVVLFGMNAVRLFATAEATALYPRFAFLGEAYEATDPRFDGRIGVPALWEVMLSVEATP